MHMGTPQKLCAKWKKPSTKKDMLYNSIYMEFPEKVKLKSKKMYLSLGVRLTQDGPEGTYGL